MTPNVAKPVVNRIQPEIAIPEIVRHEKPVSKPAVLSGWINPPVVAPKPSPEQAAAVPEPEVVVPVVMPSAQASCAIQPSAVVPSISPLGESRTSVEPEVAAPVAEPTIPADNVPLSRSEISTPPTAATTTTTLLETSPRTPGIGRLAHRSRRRCQRPSRCQQPNRW
ncbi:hypothetical protein [Paludibacterium denitrificans]|uniref:Uncharacterized protein n=1 Tax=Paludibacterium denitrificans TaxID=2675226 RepID=A0A844GAF7_9NEIS|nr:hypothetical protein [Paludibacterium denitrificans]MTD32340.1 hypothetical protein [Paludibacterium denitrificans]